MTRGQRHGGGRRASKAPAGALTGVGVGVAAILLLLGGGLLVDRWPFAFDRAIVVGLRAWGGPGWLRGAAIDVTALGSVTVLTLWVIAVVTLLAVQGRWRAAGTTLLACASVSAVIDLTKWEVARPRPTLVPHLVPVSHTSFPSGHAAGSAAIYLTLAALAGQATRDRRVGRAVIVMAVLLTGMIGTSRVYLGVHWPSDVLAGWAFGIAWAFAWRLASARPR